ncbi:sodium:solute symporter [Pseudoxanthomonas sp.]|uniref:sodium:solute symporter n=1 Tax=Pseudoxanthomonas sp. TaxID=1871049 RepID=UPI002607929B|nr:sodium:solute symporter [Pseudoxanthomonas sp.]WDS35443.1 MAG: sodium:solute symporter [Pseudoxanthomonas sp.]
MALVLMSWMLNRGGARDTRDYFLAGGRIPAWLAAISVLATTQSAATFLGVPDNGYRSDYSYMATNIGAVFAAMLVGKFFIPRFYAAGVSTVYELLDVRYGRRAMRAAGLMFLVGRILAGGARLYLAAIAVSMIIFLEVTPQGIIIASLVLALASLVFSLHGGLRTVVWIDLLQFIVYVSAAVAILVFILHRIPGSMPEIVHGLIHAPGGENKLRVLDFSLKLDKPYSMLAVMTGILLLHLGNFALDQDTTQRLLACRDARQGARGLYMSLMAIIPVTLVLIVIGSLLHVFYQRPELMHGETGAAPGATSGYGNVTVLMYFILSEVPAGLRGLVAAGIIATAVGTTMSALNAMASVMVEDFYRPWRSARGKLDERHFVHAGRISNAIMAAATLAMAVFSYYWQKYSALPLLDFVLGVMSFAYAGLLGIYLTAVFTRRGSERSALAALAVGFLVVLLMQGYVVDLLGLPQEIKRLAFPWQLCVGTAAAFVTCMAGSRKSAPLVARENTPLAIELPLR